MPLSLLKPKGEEKTDDKQKAMDSKSGYVKGMIRNFNSHHGTCERKYEVGSLIYGRMHDRWKNKTYWAPGVVMRKIGNVLYLIRLISGKLCRRHANQMKPRFENTMMPLDEEKPMPPMNEAQPRVEEQHRGKDMDDQEEQNVHVPLRRSTRERIKKKIFDIQDVRGKSYIRAASRV